MYARDRLSTCHTSTGHKGFAAEVGASAGGGQEAHRFRLGGFAFVEEGLGTRWGGVFLSEL